ncbi:hypothetical protein AKJ38_02970 [candidate division MSBL1 archaeon SCGC-AAA259I14]|uniref:Uncharacterized protein n=1 Tax=candidate division MSBL1 archaeon SCGC-AAA259I14 TaxID=1698268 RepID=A0A133UQZ1_9EURY|nr:hypothetical protein AKJ38_02970 [candidate division MSBL1 archaeon SCGC-AAA259I14]
MGNGDQLSSLRELSEDEIRDMGRGEIFSRGYDYYTRGRVLGVAMIDMDSTRVETPRKLKRLSKEEIGCVRIERNLSEDK